MEKFCDLIKGLEVPIALANVQVSPYVIVSKIVEKGIPMDIDNIPGVKIDGDNNPFFVEWFNRLYTRYKDFYTMRIGELASKDYYNYPHFMCYALFVFELFKRYGNCYEHFNKLYDLNQYIINLETGDIVNNISTNESTTDNKSELYPDESGELTPEPNSATQTKSSYKVIDSNDKVKKISDAMNRLKFIWEEMLSYFEDCFNISNPDL